MTIEFSFGECRLHVFGEGTHCLICLHGYGKSGQSFRNIAQSQKNLLVVCPDLPLHGDTKISSTKFTDDHLHELIQYIRNRYGLQGQPFYLLGYSMGARLAMAYAEKHPEELGALFLLAPDGIPVHPVYRFATSNPLGKTLFRMLTNKPGRWIPWLEMANRAGLISREKKILSTYYLGPQEAKMLYKRWMFFQSFAPSLHNLVAVMQKNHVTINIFVGNKDPLISLRRLQQFACSYPETIQLFCLDGGHDLLNQELADIIAHSIQNILSK